MTALQKLFDLTGRVAIVTGGSRGLGAEIASGLAEAGAAVMLLARREQWLAPTVEAFRDRGFRCEGALCDVANPEDVRRCAALTIDLFGALDILVNNAGATWGAPAEEMPLDKWRMVLETNLTGAFLFAQEAARIMIPRGSGCILNVASVAGLKASLPGGLNAAAYSASKGGLIALTRELAAKWARYGIRVNAIAPGFFPSRMSEKVIEAHEAEIVAGIPAGRVGHPGELKGVAVFLASGASAYITGQVIAVDGGASVV